MGTLDLNDALLRALKCAPGQRLIEIRDASIPGLEIRVWSSGVKAWRLHYTRRSDGRRRVTTLGRYPGITLKQARTRAKALQATIEDTDLRADPAAEKQARRVAGTFAELADEWLERHAKPNKRPRTVRGDQQMLQRHVLPDIGDMRLGDITKRDVIRLLDKVAAAPDARTGAERKMTHQPNRVFQLTRSIMRWGLGRDLVKIDPTAGLPPPIRKEKARERELSPDEIGILWRALDRAPLARERWKRQGDDFPMRRATALAIKLALVTAQRIGEVSGMSDAEFDLNPSAPIWTIPRERSKNDEPNRVPLSPLAVRLLGEARQLAGASRWLFPGPTGDNPIDPYAPVKAIARARALIGIGHFTVHDLRRTAATRMAETGIAPHTISLVLNHISVRRGTITGKVYNLYSYDREKREALDAWAARIEQIIAASCARDL